MQIYNWDEYLWTTVLDEFAAEYDCNYEIRTFDDAAEAAAKMNTGDIVADLFFPTYDILGRLAGAELLQPLNHSYIPNLARNVWPSLQDPFYDLGSQYSVPYVVYTTGIGYRRDVVRIKCSARRRIHPAPEHDPISHSRRGQPMARELIHPDSWLVLPPEVEELVPALVAVIGAAEADAERIEIEKLICKGSAGSWLDYLRARTEMLAAAVSRRGPSESTRALASILRDQYRLAPGVTTLADRDDESLVLLERLAEDSG